MNWYKFTLLNRMVIAVAIALVLFYLFAGRGPWDVFFYLLMGTILFGLLLLDAVVQAIQHDRKKKE